MPDIVYVFSNKAQPGWIKVGWTSRSVEERRKELSSATGVVEPFQIEAVFEIAAGSGQVAEQLAHSTLSSFKRSKEHFLCAPDIAKNLIATALDRLNAAPFDVQDLYRKIDQLERASTEYSENDRRIRASWDGRREEISKVTRAKIYELDQRFRTSYRWRFGVSWLVLVAFVSTSLYLLWPLYGATSLVVVVAAIVLCRLARSEMPLFVEDPRLYRVERSVLERAERDATQQATEEYNRLKQSIEDAYKKQIDEARTCENDLRRLGLPIRRSRKKSRKR